MTWLSALLLAPFIFLTFCFAVELFVGLRPIRTKSSRSRKRAVSVIIVPAHDEEAIIASALSALRAAAGKRAHILVVADNCTDDTAARARELGVEAIERHDPERRGKGFALDFARQHLRNSAPDIVLVVDADCTIDADSVATLIAWCASTGRPCQAVNLQAPAGNASPTVQLSTFAFFVKNVIRQRALQRLAGRAHLLGTGMAFPWAIFDRAALATDNIVEDLQMGVELAETGHRPLFVEEASVWSNPETKPNTFDQRRRWEGGYLENALRAGSGVLRRRLREADARGVWAAINLFIPPLALLVLFDVLAVLIGTGLVWTSGAYAWPLALLLASLLLACVGLGLAWARGGRRFVTLGGLACVPGYVFWKLPLYLGFARRGTPKDWIRTRGN